MAQKYCRLHAIANAFAQACHAPETDPRTECPAHVPFRCAAAPALGIRDHWPPAVEVEPEPCRAHPRRSRRSARPSARRCARPSPRRGTPRSRRGPCPRSRTRRGPAGRGRAAREPRDPATSPRTSRCSSRGRSAGRRWTSPRRSPRRSGPAATPADRLGARSRGPGFLNLRLADAAFEAIVAGILARAGAVGPVPGREPPQRQRRVRVGQPDRAAHRRQRARRVRRRPALPGPRGRRPAGHARVLLQRLGRAGDAPRRVGARDPRGEPVPEDGYHGEYVETSRPSCPTTSGPRRPPQGANAGEVVGAWACERVREGIEASLERLGVRFDVWTTEARSTTRAGSSGPSSGCAPAATCTSRTARCGSARPPSATTRTA